MKCPHCGATLQKNVKQCPFCGQQITAARRHISLGKISLSCTFATIILIIVILILFRTLTYHALPLAQFLANFVLLFSSLSIVLRSIAFFGKARDVFGLIGMMLGIGFLAILALTFSLMGLLFFKTVSLVL
jgi:hypothetical protein